jgi:hypothetical protein
MKQSRIKKVQDFGQSIWLDFFDRKIMKFRRIKEID